MSGIPLCTRSALGDQSNSFSFESLSISTCMGRRMPNSLFDTFSQENHRIIAINAIFNDAVAVSCAPAEGNRVGKYITAENKQKYQFDRFRGAFSNYSIEFQWKTNFNKNISSFFLWRLSDRRSRRNKQVVFSICFLQDGQTSGEREMGRAHEWQLKCNFRDLQRKIVIKFELTYSEWGQTAPSMWVFVKWLSM